MIRMLFRSTAGLLTALAVSGTASAQDTSQPPPTPAAAEAPAAKSVTLSGNVAITSEYRFRGISQTDEAPAIQGGFDFVTDTSKPVALYLGAWGSNVDFNEAAGVDGATVELDWYGGLKGILGGNALAWDVGAIYYTYPGADSALGYNFWDVKAAVGHDFGVASINASLNYSPDNFGHSGHAYYPKLSLGVPVYKTLSLSAYVAKQYIEKEAAFGAPDYVEWNIAATYVVAGFSLSAAYTDVDISGKKGTVLFTVARSF